MKFIIYTLLLLFSFSSIFAKEASFLSLKVQYLNSNHKVVLNATNNIDEKLEVLVSVLDEDGNLATKSKDASKLSRISNSDIDSKAGALKNAINDIDREASYYNTARFVLDYSSVSTRDKYDEITVNIAGIKKTIKADFSYVKAKGLVLRVSTKSITPQENQGKEFSNISIDGDNNLSIQSKAFPGATSGSSVPIKIYASTSKQSYKSTDSGAVVKGRFTLSPQLNGAKIVVNALADYDGDGIADVLINQEECIMQNGIATLNMKITKGLPADKNNVHTRFSNKIINGLGVSFIAYVKDDISIANVDDLDYQDIYNPIKFRIGGDFNSSDSVIVKSDIARNIKIGIFDASAKTLQEQWSRPYVNYYILDDNNSATSQDINLTAVDRFGNPAEVVSSSRVDCSYANKYFDIDGCRDRFDGDNRSIYTLGLTVKREDDSKPINYYVKEGLKIYEELKILGTGGISSSKALNIGLYMGRYTKDYMTYDGYSGAFGDINTTISSSSSIDKDYKVILKQTEANSTTLDAYVYPRDYNGKYSNSYLSSKNELKIKKTGGGSISISGVGRIGIASYSQASGSRLDGLTAYFFRVQSVLDNSINILASSSTSARSENGRTKVQPGGELRFYIKGLASHIDDYIEVIHGRAGYESNIRLASDDKVLNQFYFINKTGGFVGSDRALAIKGYTITSSRDFEVMVNGHKIVSDSFISARSNLEITTSEQYGLYQDIEFQYDHENSDRNTKQIRIEEFAEDNPSFGDGASETSLLPLNDMDGDKITRNHRFSPTTSPVVYKGEVLANKYYLLFNRYDDLTELDAFGNELKTDNNQSRILKNYEYRISGRGDVDVTDDKVWVKFSNRDAGGEVVVTIRSRYGENTIKFVNIKPSGKQNDKYIIAPVYSQPQVNLVNTEVLLKIIGDHRNKSEDMSIEFSHSDQLAKVGIVKVEPQTESFTDSLGNYVSTSMSENGVYFLIRVDRPGNLTIKVSGRENDDRNRAVTINTTQVLRFVTFDRKPPSIYPPKVNNNQITAQIQDGNLDYEKTIIEARNSEDVVVKQGGFKNGLFTLSDLPKGSYQIRIKAVDLFGNEVVKTFTREVINSISPLKNDKNTTIAQPVNKQVNISEKMINLANKMSAHNAYSIIGKFIYYEVGDLYYKNWILQSSVDKNTYQIKANNTNIDDAFGFEEIIPDITKLRPSKWWYLVQLDGVEYAPDARGKFGWIVVNSDLSIVKKLTGIRSDGTLSYEEVPLRAVQDKNRLIFLNKY